MEYPLRDKGRRNGMRNCGKGDWEEDNCWIVNLKNVSNEEMLPISIDKLHIDYWYALHHYKQNP